MAEYEGCSDGNCILRDEPLRVHTNAGCRCLKDIPAARRIAIQRRIRGQQAEVERLSWDRDKLIAECERLRIKCGKSEMLEGDYASLSQQQAEIERLKAELERRKTTYEGWHVVKEHDDGSLLLQSHTGARRHVWQGCDEKAHKENDAEIKRLREFIRYWSYCTRQGMLAYCPEKKPELIEKMREFGIEN